MKGASLKSYTVGFLTSIALTLTAYALVVAHLMAGWMLVAAILVLAVVQLAVQMLFFLHIGSESGGGLNLFTFLTTLSMVLIIVAGSIWIMAHLNYSMMASPSMMQDYIQSQQGF
jgi:cytochrome o ubiquinol oxidase subunit IV